MYLGDVNGCMKIELVGGARVGLAYYGRRPWQAARFEKNAS
jgi:hypothetical protein